MSDTTDACCPDCGADRSDILKELAALRQKTAEATAAAAASEAEFRVYLEQRMEAGEDITPVLEALQREGFDVGDLLIG